ncbi:MAG: serine protease [Alphaproteobacteria bacterium]|nr:serine protease [Alphaproteobacteria bacterium]
MSDINKDVLFSVVRINAKFTHKEFKDQIKSIVGTGFWLEVDGKQIFVTNKHNVDPSLKLGGGTPYELTHFEIELRQRVPPNQFLPTTHFFEVNNLKHCLIAHPTADCAIFLQPQFKNPASDFSPFCMRIGLAEGEKLFAESDFNGLSDLATQASFIGFPMGWHDTAWNLPIVRPLAIASYPNISYTNSNSEIKTTDVHLVSGLSFKGSSGSPVIMHAKGIRINVEGVLTKSGNSYTPCAVLGIMSGHIPGVQASEMFNHSGLSYYTRSTSILELLKLKN